METKEHETKQTVCDKVFLKTAEIPDVKSCDNA